MTTTRPKGTITRRLILSIVLFSSLITLVITAFQLFDEFQNGVDQVERQITQIKTVSLGTLTDSLWNLYEKQVQTQLDNLVQYPDIQYLEIRTRGEIVASSGVQQKYANTISETFPLIYVRDDQSVLIGDLLVIATLEEVYQGLYDRIFIILISNGIKTALVSLFIFLIFQVLVTRHLVTISDYLESFSIDQVDKKLNLNRGSSDDELDCVANSINQLALNLSQTTVSKDYIDNIVTSMADSLFVINPDATIRLTNRAAHRLLGYEERELIGQSKNTIFGDEGGKSTDELMRKGIIREQETTCSSKLGRRSPCCSQPPLCETRRIGFKR